jgi:hypothetical protein
MMQTMKLAPSPAIILKRKWKLVQCAAKFAPKRRARRPTLASVAKQATKAGIEVASYEVKPGKIVVVTGKPNEQTNNEPNPWERAMGVKQ